MSRKFLGVIIIALLVFVLQSCEDEATENTLLDDSSTIEMTQQSAIVSSQTYIVLLDDTELSDELSELKGYEKKQLAVKAKGKKILERAGIVDGEVVYTYGTAIQGFSVKMAPGQMKKLSSDASVKFVEVNQVATLVKPDVKINKKPVPTPPAQTVPWGITRVNGGVDGTGKTAWIIDTGIDLDHPDLNVDASKGATFVAHTSTPDDDNGHGSHCAGIIGAIDNQIGVIGVAANATVVPVKVLNRRGSGTYDAIIAGIDFVAANASNGDVANMSLGGGYSEILNTAVENAAATGVKFALAAGNESTSATTKSPASASGSNIYTISAMGEGDVWSYYSNYDNPPVDFCEPGTYIYSTYKNGGYETLSGTSMASPHAAGILLLGNISTDGYVSGDPDGNADPIGVH